jgi:1-acyl-sn-glycerol-3-phosphate acyltransferase
MIYNAPLRSFVRITLYMVWIVLICIPIQAAATALRLPFAKRFPIVVHRVCVRLIGARVAVKGKQRGEGGVLFVSNHCSYADISVLGALIRGSFVAKAEIADWPLYGWCAKLSGTVFVDRRRRYAKQQAELMKRRLSGGDRLIMFAEGTTSDGNRVLPFRSSLFQTAEIELDGRPVLVQPVSIAYSHLDGIPMGRHFRPFYAWYGDMGLMSHMWELIGLGRATVTVEFHEPVTIRDFADRKALAAYCQGTIAAGVSAALTGRAQPAPARPVPAEAAALPAPAAGAA